MNLKNVYLDLKKAEEVNVSVGVVNDVKFLGDDKKIVYDEKLNFILIWSFKTETTIRIKSGKIIRNKKYIEIYTDDFLYRIKYK